MMEEALNPKHAGRAQRHRGDNRAHPYAHPITDHEEFLCIELD
jgi:hypothetical protein